MAAPSAAVASPAQDGARVQWLDGIRGVSATFVVLHHIWLTAWPSDTPTNPGPPALPERTTVEHREAEALARRLLDAIGTRDREALTALMSRAVKPE